MNILVTGCAGFLGSKLAGHLLELGHTVTGYDNLMYDSKSLLRYVPCEKFNFIKGDVRNTETLLKHVKKADVIIPLAALVGAPLCDKNPVDAVLVNYTAIKNICDTKSNNQLILYPNSNSGYGHTNGTEPITENDPLNPISLYGTSKADAEKVVQNTKNHVTMRLATVFGASLRVRSDLLVNNLVLRAMKDKVLVLYESEYMRNYIHIDDICRAFLHTMNNESCWNNTFNVGNDSINMSKMDLCKKIKNHLPVEIIKADYTRDPDQRNYIVSSLKLYNTGFECKYDLDYGIKELIKMYQMIDVPVNANY